MLSSNGYATAKYGKNHLSGWEKKVPTMHGLMNTSVSCITLGIISVSVRKMLMLMKEKRI